jgi:hypothetical protein
MIRQHSNPTAVHQRRSARVAATVVTVAALFASCSSDSGRSSTDSAGDTSGEPAPVTSESTESTDAPTTDAPSTEASVPSTESSAPDVDAVELPPGVAPPNDGTGIGTPAAMDRPDCTTGDLYTAYGRLNSFAEGAGPICVRPFEDGEDNGGATSTGVTADSITVVFLVPASDAQAQASSNRATGEPGNDRDAFHDLIIPMAQYYETWGRSLDVKFVDSSGSDEAAQRADAIAVLELDPFVVINGDTSGLDVFEAEIAKADTLVFGYAASPAEVEALAPYRWGGNDPQAAMVNAAEAVGKQLVGKPAQWAGSDDLKAQERTFGLVYMDEVIDAELFTEEFSGFDGELAVQAAHPANGSTFGDPAIAQQYGPTIVAQMKEAGVTTVLLASDVAMIKTMMEEASRQDWYPEWFSTGVGYFDFQPFTSSYPPEQASQMFGLALLSPYLTPDADPAVAAISGATAPINWYFGEGTGTTTPRILAATGWLLAGIHTAGPNLTAATFQQGLFSVPASGGSISDNPLVPMTGFGGTTQLPYPGYFTTPLDFAVEWISVDTEGPAPAIGAIGKPAQMFLNEGARYSAGNWPTDPIPFFDASQSITDFATRPASVPTPVPVPCDGCPIDGGSDVTVGSPSPDGFIVEPPSAS